MPVSRPVLIAWARTYRVPNTKLRSAANPSDACAPNVHHLIGAHSKSFLPRSNWERTLGVGQVGIGGGEQLHGQIGPLIWPAGIPPLISLLVNQGIRVLPQKPVMFTLYCEEILIVPFVSLFFV